MSGQPHALLFVTGWLSEGELEGRLRLHGLPVPRSVRETGLVGTRVRGVLSIKGTFENGRVQRTHLHKLRPAQRQPNGVTFSVCGKLHRFDSSTGTLTVRLPSRREGQIGVPIHMRCTRVVFATIRPEWRMVQVNGGVIDGLLIIDSVRGAGRPGAA